MTNMNTQFESLRESATVAMADRVASLRAQGRTLVGLEVGDPDFATPQPVVDVALRAMQSGWTHYVPSRGVPEFRQAVAESLFRDYALHYDPQAEILVTHGGVHAFYCALQSILNPGDEVLILDPSWATHANMVTMLRGKPVRVPARAEDGFLPRFEAWQQALTNRTKALVVNWPNNPTGTVPPREYLLRLQEFASVHDLWVISDEVYSKLVYDENQHTCLASLPGAQERTLLVNSLSKTYAMTGWRVGYLAAPARVISNALKTSQNSITCVAPFVQKAAAFALTDPGVQQAAAEMRSAYARRRELVLHLAEDQVDGLPVRVMVPQGAFYFFLDFRPLGLSSIEVCERLLDEASVALVPGSAFGEMGEGFARLAISSADEQIQAGFEAILRWAARAG